MKKIFLIIIIIVVVFIIAVVGVIFWLSQPQTSEYSKELITDEELSCLSSGGTVSIASCCESTGDFPGDCAIGACGCAPKYSHGVKICDCGKNNCFDGVKCVNYEEHLKERGMLDESSQPGEKLEKVLEPEEKEEQIKVPSSYHIENAPYYREDRFCWGGSAIMLMMYQGFSEGEIQEFRTVLKSGLGGPPDMFNGFSEFGVLGKVRIVYLEGYSKEYADFYNQILINPTEQVLILKDKNEALEKLKELISSDILVSIVGHHGNHYMIVTGYDEDYIYISDPGIDDVFFQKIDYQAEYEEKTKMSIENFFEQWTVSGFEGGGIGFPGDGGIIWLEK